MMNLNTRAWLSLVILAFCMGLVLFVCAGTAVYWQGWVYLSLFIGASTVITVYLMRRDRALLERRMTGGPTAEKRPVQKLIMLFASLAFVALLVVPALDYRFGMSNVPAVLVGLGDILVVAGFYFIFVVYRANTFTSSTIEVTEDQNVIDTGPYAIIRHPMYASALIYLVGTPLALGSYWGFIALAAMLPVLIWRLFDEETLLTTDLSGYSDYQKRVRYRLVPFVW